jgi:hypothetical protein
MRFSDFLTGLGRPIYYQPELTHITGALTAGIFICNLVQWTGKQKDAAGWIYKTQDELFAETGLSRREQETARKILKDRHLLEEVKRGTPARLYYRVNLDTLNDAVDDYLASKDGGNRQTVEAETAAVECPNPPRSIGENRHAIPEYTPEVTQKELQRDTAASGGARLARPSPLPPIAYKEPTITGPSPEVTAMLAEAKAHVRAIAASRSRRT